MTQDKKSVSLSSHPAVYLTSAGAHAVRLWVPWLRPSHIDKHPEVDASVVSLYDQKGVFLGTAMYTSQSKWPLRLLSKQHVHLGKELIYHRMKIAQQYRSALFSSHLFSGLSVVDAYRMVHGEADGLPGLIIDRYGDSAVIQTSTRAMDQNAHEIMQVLVENFGIKQVVLRDDGSNRDLDGLPRSKKVLYGSLHTRVSFHDAGLLMEADLLLDSKTGAFLDQQENHAFCQSSFFTNSLPKGRALDAFTYHGGFALSLARAGFSVIAGDENQEAIERAKQNAIRNQLSVQFQVRNAFDWLRQLESNGEKFSVVVIDPPALAKRGKERTPKSSFDAAHRAYKELNLRAFRLLEPGGVLISCSCSGSLNQADFAEILTQAARDAGKLVQIIQQRGAGHDHPPLLGYPETGHLKCFVLRVLPL